MKSCSKCKEVKEVFLFSKNKGNNDGLDYKCKKCKAVQKLCHNRTKKGKLKRVYDSQVSGSKKRGHEPPAYTKKEFVDRFINDSKYLDHYDVWEASGFGKPLSPSFDRLDDYKGYSFYNIQIMYWFENKNKSHSDRKNGINNKHSKRVIGTNIKTNDVVEFCSGREAERRGFNQSHISSCCLGKSKTHLGYKWEYKN